jgi:hypothetical protein
MLSGLDGAKCTMYADELFFIMKAHRIDRKELFDASDEDVVNALKQFKAKHPSVKIIKY